MIPSYPPKRIRVRRLLFAIQFLIIVAITLTSAVAAADFASLMTHLGAAFFYLCYVPWALVIDRKTGKEVEKEQEKVRARRRGEIRDPALEGDDGVTIRHIKRGQWWRIDRAWAEVVFLCLQIVCFLSSAVIAGLQGGPSECAQAILDAAAGISSIDNLVPNTEVTRFCNSMTAIIALSSMAIAYDLALLWWVVYAVRSLRKIERVQKEGEPVAFVREKAWRISFSRLLRREEDDDVVGVRKVGQDGMVELLELETGSRSLSTRQSLAETASVVPGPGHMSREGSLAGPYSAGHGSLSLGSPDGRPERPPLATLDTGEILQQAGSPENTSGEPRSDFPPPPYYIRNRASVSGPSVDTAAAGNSGTAGGAVSTSPTTSISANSSSRYGTYPSASSGSNHAGTTSVISPSRRPLPLVPRHLEEVVERKMEEMAEDPGSAAGTSTYAPGMAEWRGPPSAGPPSASQPPLSAGIVEALVDIKINHAAEIAQGAASGSGGAGNTGTNVFTSNGPGTAIGARASFERSGSGTASSPTSQRPSHNNSYSPSTNPTEIETPPPPPLSALRSASSIRAETAPPSSGTWPGASPSSTSAADPSIRRQYDKAAEAGFRIDQPPPNSGVSPHSQGMSLEEMVERKMASLQAAKRHPTGPGSGYGHGHGHGHPPTMSVAVPHHLNGIKSADEMEPSPHGMALLLGPVVGGANANANSTTSPESQSAIGTRTGQSRKGKGKRKGRARAGSDPGPARWNIDESDEDE